LWWWWWHDGVKRVMTTKKLEAVVEVQLRKGEVMEGV
jgi:hypothetical protein